MSYKYSIPSGWIEETLNDYCIKVADGTHDSPKVSESGKLLVTSKNIIGGTLDLTKSYLISENDFHEINKRSKVDLYDVLLSMIGTVGEVCLIQEKPDFAIKNVGLLKNSDPIKASWLYFYLTSPQAKALIKERLRGTTQQYIPLGEIRKFPIIYPESPEALNRLVTILASLKNKIELNRQINQTLEAMAQAIFKSWFVDFEPVKAKMVVLQAGGSQDEAELAAMMAISGKTAEQLSTMRTTQAEAYQQLTQTAALFPAAMQESELGEIPEGWASGSLASIMDIAGGTQPPANEFLDKPSDGYVRLIQIRDYETDAHLTFVKDTKKLRKTSIKDLMIARYGASVGRICWGLEGAYNVALVRVVCEPHFTEFLRSYLSTDNFQKRLAQMSGRSAQAGFNKSDIASFDLVIPTNSVVIEYEKIAWSLREFMLRSKKENAQLEQARDSLLPKLLSGEIDLPTLDEVAA